MVKKDEKLISLKAASGLTPYSSEYLGLLIRKGKLEGKKVGGKWMTTPQAVEFYLQKAAESSYEHRQNLNVKVPAEEVKKAATNFRWMLALCSLVLLTGLVTWKTMDDKRNEDVRYKYRIASDKDNNVIIYADRPEEIKSVKVLPKQ